ncbi:RNA recognition motif, partial [Trifolium medium]|nr:RNA recognition motif [Trifolium medium]
VHGRNRASERGLRFRSIETRCLAETDTGMAHHRGKFQFEDDDAGARSGFKRKRNVHNNKFGFVRYSKVRDVTKLLRAINDISFGKFRIWARVARFDKAYDAEEE